MATINEILSKAKSYLDSFDESRIKRAYDFANEAHIGQKRFSGEPYITHPLHVTDILLDFHPDEDTLIAALLHDVAEDTSRTLDDIEAEFGKTVRSLCSGMLKLSKVHSRLNDPQIENLRKLFLAMAKDFRVVLIKLCDRLHNMLTLSFVRPEKRLRIAQETLNIYAPIAARLGIYSLKSQLEDLCFEYMYPEEFHSISEQLAKTGRERERYIEEVKKILTDTLSQEDIQADVDGRIKSAYSIYHKMHRKGKTSVSEIFDIFAMRVIMPDIYKYEKEYIGHLYTALGIIHNQFTPLANRFKDYVAVPKVNGYRSLHTTVVGLGPKVYTQPTEIQIRTISMHRDAELGIAAHWIYKESPRTPRAPYFIQEQQEWISGLGKMEQNIKDNQELLENLRVDIFHDRIFVLTPRGEVKDLPLGATPVDFAYAVHTEIGNHCIGAKVNGAIAQLDRELKNGEVIEIITRKNAKPSHQWLSFVKTTHARNRLRNWFRHLDETKYLRVGKELLNDKLQQFGKSLLDDSLSLLRNYDGKNLSMRYREELLIEIGRGAIFPITIIRKLFTLNELLASHAYAASIKKDRNHRKRIQQDISHQTPELIIGEENAIPYNFVKCCNAKFSDDLIGYTTRGRGISIHKKTCTVVAKSELSRLIPIKRADHSMPRYAVHVLVAAADRIGLMRDVSHTIAENSVNIIDVMHKPPRKGELSLNLILEIQNIDQLDRLLSKLENIPSVRRACKIN